MADSAVPRPSAPGPDAAPSHSPSPIRRTYAALDLGTNNCRLLIARPSADGFVIVDAFSRIVRLGEGLGASERLGQAAMDRALAALRVCADKMQRRRVALARSVATEACRRARNGRAFVERVHAETGIALDVISPGEEARLAVLGCHHLLEPGDGPALIFDIGGGSTELVVLEGGSHDEPRIAGWCSLPWGVVSLGETEPDDLADPVERLASYDRMRGRVAEAAARYGSHLLSGESGLPRLMGASGTVTTLASIHLGLPVYDRRVVDGSIVPTASMRAISARLSSLSVAERATIACVGNERADLVVAGCAILEGILDIWPVERLTVADRGIREGILRQLMARDGHRL
jgi:exopolyphosphatase/guanosine-5'-triphosphate,3'-diphosphate pyrophosphatase